MPFVDCDVFIRFLKRIKCRPTYVGKTQMGLKKLHSGVSFSIISDLYLLADMASEKSFGLNKKHENKNGEHDRVGELR